MRFENSENLFGGKRGSCTTQKVQCDICKKVYEETGGNEKDSIKITNFADLVVAECCFEKIEKEVILRMPFILPWFIKILEDTEKTGREYRDLINEIRKKMLT